MQSELYTAAQGLLARQLHLDNIANNIANGSTTGFREVTPFFRSYNKALEEGPANPLNNAANNQPVIAGLFQHSRQGSIKHTGQPLDVAISGEGLFKVNTPFGNRYTRNGHFGLDENGMLTTQNGYPVLTSQGNTITLNRDYKEITITREGEVTQDGTSVGKIGMFTFADKASLTPEEDTLLFMQDPTAVEQPAKGQLIKGALENSNVNVAKQMVDLITAQRAYDMNIRTIRTIDSTMNQGVIRGFGPR